MFRFVFHDPDKKKEKPRRGSVSFVQPTIIFVFMGCISQCFEFMGFEQRKSTDHTTHSRACSHFYHSLGHEVLLCDCLSWTTKLYSFGSISHSSIVFRFVFRFLPGQFKIRTASVSYVSLRCTRYSNQAFNVPARSPFKYRGPLSPVPTTTGTASTRRSEQ